MKLFDKTSSTNFAVKCVTDNVLCEESKFILFIFNAITIPGRHNRFSNSLKSTKKNTTAQAPDEAPHPVHVEDLQLLVHHGLHDVPQHHDRHAQHGHRQLPRDLHRGTEQ